MSTDKRYPQCILANCCVPWDEDEALFRRTVANLRDNLTPHLYVFGTAGEGYAVDSANFGQICEAFYEEMRGPETYPMVGIITLSLNEMITRIERAANIGFKNFQVSLPSWDALTWGEIQCSFKEVCERFPDYEFLHYNLPRVKRLVTPGEYAILSAEHPNLVATKNSTADMLRLEGLLREAPQLRHFFTEIGYAYGSLIGDCSFLVSVASCHFDVAKQYFSLGKERKANDLLRLQQQLIALTNMLIATCGNTAHIDGAFDMVFLKLLDPSFPLRLLPPYATVSGEDFQLFRERLSADFNEFCY